MPDTDDLEYVVFLLPDGTEVSNDPRWKTKQFKDQIERQNASLKAQADYAAKAQAERFAKEAGLAEEDPKEEDEADGPSDGFDDLTVPELKQEAEERDIDLRAAGVKKKSELVELLRNHDAVTKGQ